MFYTMTLNPALDYNMTLNEFARSRVNRSVKEEMIPGGKGLMVSRMLKNLGIESTAFGLVAGFTGAELTRMVHDLGVRTSFVSLPWLPRCSMRPPPASLFAFLPSQP